MARRAGTAGGIWPTVLPKLYGRRGTDPAEDIMIRTGPSATRRTISRVY